MFFRMLIFVCVILMFETTQAQTADDIIKKHIEAIGGYEKIKAIKTIIFEGSLKLPNKERTFKTYIVHDSANRTENTDNGITGYGIVTKTDGWTYSPITSGNRIKKKSKQEIKKFQSSLDIHGPLVDYKDKGNKITYLGKENIDGKECFKLRLVKHDKEAFIYYFDSTYLVSRVVYLRQRDWVPEFTTNYVYKKMDNGLSFVIRAIRLEDGRETDYKYYLIDPEIDRSLFKPGKPG